MNRIRAPALSRYASRSMLAYVALSLPAIILEILFSFSIASNPNLDRLGAQFGPLGQVIVTALTIAPWLVVIATMYAVLVFRSSVVLTSLVVSYFLSSAVQGAVASATGFELSATSTALSVVTATFLALIAFGFARSIKIRGSKKPNTRSGGSILFQALGLAFDFAVPGVIAIVLVLATIGMFSAVKGTLAALPPPLSGVFTSNLTSPVLAVGATLVVAGITLWTVRELIEPWVLYYSITKEDATKLLLADLKTISKPAETVVTRNGKGLLLTVVIIIAISFGSVVVFGPEAILKNLSALYGGQAESYKSFVVQSNLLYDRIQNAINEAIKLLWG